MTVFLSKWPRTLSLVFLLAFLIRAAFILTQHDGFYFPDSLEYSRAAVNLLQVGEFDAMYDRAPGYPLFLAIVYFLFGESIFAVRLVESVMGAFLAVIIAALGRRVAGEIAGALAGTLWSIYPMGIFIAGLVYPAGLAAMLLTCGVWCMLPPTHEELSGKRVFSSGLFLGLAALTIPVALLTIVVITSWVFYWARHSRLVLASLLLIGSAVSLAPWAARNFLVYQQVMPMQANFQQHLPKIGTDGAKVGDDRVAAILRQPGRYLLHFGRNFMRFWELYPTRIKMSDQSFRDKLHADNALIIKETVYIPSRLINAVSIFSSGPILLFALFGSAAMWLRRDMARALSLLWMIALSFAVGYAFFFGKIRYRIPVEPCLIILSTYGINTACTIIAPRFNWILQPARTILSRRSTCPNLDGEAATKIKEVS